MLDRVLSTIATAQAVWVTVQAGSKIFREFVVHNDHTGSGTSTSTFSMPLSRGSAAPNSAPVTLDLPLILPPINAQERLFLYDLTLSFREGVRLGLELDKYAAGANQANANANATASHSYQIIRIESMDKEDYGASSSASTETEAYRMSLLPAFLPPKATTPSKALPLSQQPRVATGSLTQNMSNGLDLDLDLDLCWQTEYTTVSNYAVTIRSYTPRAFTKLRSSFGLRDGAFRSSILESGPYCSFQSNSKGAARMGGSFFFTQNGEYLVKTVKRDEMKTLLHMLPKYLVYMNEHGRLSLLNRFCGLYEVYDKNGKEDDRQYLVVMNSVFPGGDVNITERFDLKGSTLGRKASVEERAKLGSKAVLKDLDLAHEFMGLPTIVTSTPLARAVTSTHVEVVASTGVDSTGAGLHIGPAKAEFMAQLRRDVEFLRDCGVIDYSLLVGVASAGPVDVDRTATRGFLEAVMSCFRLCPADMLPSPTILRSMPTSPLAVVRGERKGQPAMYYFGLIDFLQPFDYKKDLEYRLKGLIHAKGTYSCVPPELYAERFLDFVCKYVT